jgi:hypothetical protein
VKETADRWRALKENNIPPADRWIMLSVLRASICLRLELIVICPVRFPDETFPATSSDVPPPGDEMRRRTFMRRFPALRRLRTASRAATQSLRLVRAVRVTAYSGAFSKIS